MNRSRILCIAFVILLLNSGWVWAFPQPSLLYIANVLLHIGLGAVLLGALWIFRDETIRLFRREAKPALAVLSLAGAFGLLLSVIGATRAHYWIVFVHGSLGFLGALLAWLYFMRRSAPAAKPLAAALAVALLLPAGSWVQARWFPSSEEQIVNPTTAPVSMDHEGGGVNSPFFPSSSVTNTGGLIPSDFFMDSKVCAECHQAIYDQWNSSVHHFSSFNNQFYRKSVEYMQTTAGVQASKWCAGCHDHAMFFNGRFERPVIEQLDTPQAHAGLGCMSCHSITHVPDSMGNGAFTMTYPPLHELSMNENPMVRWAHNYVIETAPAAHRRAFLKPFMRADASEFCSTCHKVHLDVPVNNYRWFRGFNEYDAWQASGVSGMGARSFYYPPQSSTCVDCHMPLVDAKDPAAKNGKVRSHHFPGANTAVAYVNHDKEQLKRQTDFLQDDIVTVDIFAASPIDDEPGEVAMRRRTTDAPIAATTFGVGEEAESTGGSYVLRDVGRIAAPLNRVKPVLNPGATIKVDVVVRTRKVGHLFPGGTVDSFDVWVELVAVDARDRAIYWSGMVEDEGQGPVEPGAHFYRSFLLDEHGNHINKRNAFQARSLLYVRLIPPGAADTVHFRMKVPEDVEGPIRLIAKLNYRKFSQYYTQFSYAGQPDSTDPKLFGKDFDDRTFTFKPANIPANVSGQIKDRIPALPIVVMSQAEVELPVGREPTRWEPQIVAEDHLRWNDWGIGMLLQGDLKGAEYAFHRVAEAKPDYADSWLNIARGLIQEGQTEAAKPFIQKALEINSSFGRIHFFNAMIQKADGDYDAALASLRTTEAQYPKDRVVLNQIARILFLKRDYTRALDVLDRVARIDPEDLQMHYTRMLCYRGAGDVEKAAQEETLFRRFKADESSQTITGRIRQQSPEDNNERQAIHEHVSTPFPAGLRYDPVNTYRGAEVFAKTNRGGQGAGGGM